MQKGQPHTGTKELRPLVSVVMAVYNSEPDLDKTVDSVLTQNWIDFEFIIINDGSLDGSGVILDDYASRDCRIVVIHQENIGLTKSLIRGCALARGKYIARQDAGGDTSLPGRLAAQVAFLERNPEVVMTSCGTQVIGPRGEELYTVSQDGRELHLALSGRTTSTLRGPSSHGSTMFRTDAYFKVGGYRPEFPVAQDLDLWVRLSEVGECLAIPSILCRVVLAKGAISHLRREEQIERTAAILASAKKRRSGQSDSEVLSLSSRQTVKQNRGGRRLEAKFYYFVASVLRSRNPTAAAEYYREALRAFIIYPKAWAGLFVATIRMHYSHTISPEFAPLVSRQWGRCTPTDMLVHESKVSIVIPTYGRDAVLIQTISHLLALEQRPREILIVDQTAEHSSSVQAALDRWEALGKIRCLKLAEPSITKAMNLGLKEAQCEIVLFLDDDIIPEPGLLSAHYSGHRIHGVGAIAGRVIQPWQEGKDFTADPEFHFASTRPGWVNHFIGCNFSVKRSIALDIGGFDENFVRVAYNFEAEFASRLISYGHKMLFEPEALIHHLKIPSGGTRAFGEHLTTIAPGHAVGAYYHLFRTRRGWRRMCGIVERLVGSVVTRHHLRRPWWIPVTLLAEAQGLVWASVLCVRGPRYASAFPLRSDV